MGGGNGVYMGAGVASGMQLRAEKGEEKSCCLVCVSSVVIRCPGNQQGRLYTALWLKILLSKSFVLPLMCQPSPPRMQFLVCGQYSIAAGAAPVCFPVGPCWDYVHCSQSELAVVFPAEKASSSCSATV